MLIKMIIAQMQVLLDRKTFILISYQGIFIFLSTFDKSGAKAENLSSPHLSS
jgi:hypothetical protein